MLRIFQKIGIKLLYSVDWWEQWCVKPRVWRGSFSLINLTYYVLQYLLPPFFKVLGELITFYSIFSSKLLTNSNNFSGDYETVVGYPIDYQRFNFSSLEEFLRSLPSLRVCGTGGRAMVEAATKNDSKHVSDLISKQKPSKKVNIQLS